MLMSQLMAAQAPGLWQSQLANAAARIEPPSPPAQVYTYSPSSWCQGGGRMTNISEGLYRKTHITAWLLMTLYAFFIRYHRTSCIFSSLRFSCRAASPPSTWRQSRGRSDNSSRFHTFQTIHDMSIEHPKNMTFQTIHNISPKKHDFSDDPAAVTKLLASPPVWS